MGCFPSTARDPPAAAAPTSPNNSRRSHSHTASRGAPDPASTAIAIVPTTSANASARPNAPLASPRPWRRASHPSPSGAAWTPALLRRERDAFFDTRVAGAPEVWAAVRLATEMAAGGDVTGAQGVLDAAGCTVPRGRLEEGVWDEKGTLYGLPRWVVCDPVDMEGDEDEDEDEEVEGEDEEKDIELRRDEKGKARSGDKITVRARLSDRGSDVVVVVDKGLSVRAVVREVQEQASIPTSTKVKLAYLGKMLKEGESLHGQGWQANHVVNAFVFQ